MHYTKKLNEVKQVCKTVVSTLGQIPSVEEMCRDAQFSKALKTAREGLDELSKETPLTTDADACAAMEDVIGALEEIANNYNQSKSKEYKELMQEALDHVKGRLGQLIKYLD